MKTHTVRTISFVSVFLRFVIALLFTLPFSVQASLVVTLSDDGSGGTIATFVGSGTTSGSEAHDTSIFNVGNYTTVLPAYPLYTLSPSLAFAPGIDIIRFSPDEDSDHPTDIDDLSIGYSIAVPIGTNYSINASASVVGLSFSGFTPGVYPNGNDLGVSLGGFTLVVSEVPIPPALWLFGSGLLGLLGVSTRKKAAQ